MDDNLTKTQINVVFLITSSIMDINNDSSSSNSSSSESDCLSDEDNDELSTIYAILMIGETRGPYLPGEKLTDYVERVVPGYSKQIFKEHFR